MVGFSLISTIWGFSRISKTSKFSRISRKWTFLQRPLFQKTPFPKDEFTRQIPQNLKSGTLKMTHIPQNSASPKPHPFKPHPCNMPQAKTEVALQLSECCAAGTALQHRRFCSVEVIWTRSCAAANEKLHCNIEKAVLQESGAFPPLSCGFQAPTFRHPRFGPAEKSPVF